MAGIEKLNTAVEGLSGEFAAMRALVENRLPQAAGPAAQTPPVNT